MTKKNKIIVAVTLGIATQFIPVDQENPKPTGEIIVPKEIKTILERSCYDCHSNNTVWPFYSKIFPLSILISNHVKEGREELNFSEWENLSPKKKNKKASEIAEEVESKEMPPLSYRIFHSKSSLADTEIKALKKWSEKIEQEFENQEKNK
ncbi:MAG: heme-binding domain-containing protein [Leptospiraceae bacterium]|nr:heme-binding domain-containing protein [Leptospiraceae bacterium]